MAEKVEVIIKIPKYYLTHLQDYSCLAECVRRGVQLTKGHGDLVDRDNLLTESYCTKNWMGNDISIVSVRTVEMADAIIEADKEDK